MFGGSTHIDAKVKNYFWIVQIAGPCLRQWRTFFALVFLKLNIYDQVHTALLFNKFFSVDVSEAFEEGQRAERVRVSNFHISHHCLDQSHEGLQLRGYINCKE